MKKNYSTPEAYIAVGGNRQKIYSGAKIYLNNNDEFELELFNPTTGTVGAKIYINDESISDSLIVIRPGQREYLDRYLDDNRKFMFDTYRVEDTKESKAAIAKNGWIRVEFFKAVPPKLNLPYWNPAPGWNPAPTVWPPTIWPPQPYTNTPGIFNTNTSRGVTTGNIGDVSTTFTSGMVGACKDVCSMDGFMKDDLETGRIEGGGESDQNFTNYYGEFESCYCKRVSYQILPASTKPVEIAKIRQYCTGCRNRIRKSSWRWCPSCGEQLN